MARPPKKGLDYFPKDTDYYNDEKIIELLERYGPLGQTVYDVILCTVYKNGYYAEISPERLAVQIIRLVGNRWIKNKEAVVNIIHYCAEIGLFDNDLLEQNVVTSAGIQRRYAEVTARNKVDKSKYRLLPEDEVSASETGVSVAETRVSTEKTPQRKENKNKLNERKEDPPAPKNSGQRAGVPPSADNINNNYKVIGEHSYDLDKLMEHAMNTTPVLKPSKYSIDI